MRRNIASLVIITLVVIFWWVQRELVESVTDPPDTPSETASATRGADELAAFLPTEARRMVGLIQVGGPFAHSQDGAIFGNREKLLPHKPRGYYREYTVVTPGLNHRGARRIVTGGTPPEVWYYTQDHYRHFRRFEVVQ